jgi:hypothetical protein
MTIPLEHIQDHDWAGVNRVVDTLRSLVLNTGGVSLSLRVGTTTLTWANGAANSAVATVTHGLGRTPAAVLALGNGTGGPNLVVVQAFTIGATTFQMQGGFLTGTSTGTTNVTTGWVVIG